MVACMEFCIRPNRNVAPDRDVAVQPEDDIMPDQTALSDVQTRGNIAVADQRQPAQNGRPLSDVTTSPPVSKRSQRTQHLLRKEPRQRRPEAQSRAEEMANRSIFSG